MSTTAYEHILQALEHLTPEERRRLREVLDAEACTEPSAPSPDEGRARAADWFAAGDKLAARIGAAWKDDMSAADAVKEQRRDL
jgi:hypothetical protein